MTQAVNNLTQLIVLGVGIVIGVLIAPKFERHVQAEAQTPPSPGTVGPGTTVIPLTSVMSSPALAANVVLAHELEADHAVVNGYDLLLLDQNIVNYLATLPLANSSALDSIGARSKATTRYTLPQRTNNPAGGASSGTTPK